MREPEEIIEGRLLEVLAAAVPGMDVLGALTPAEEGDQKQSADTYVGVFVDLSAPITAYRAPVMPCAYSIRVTVRYARADDADGSAFRDSCRAVRAALAGLCGDQCRGLDGDGFECDDFGVISTQTEIDTDAEVGGIVKTYNATASGRIVTKE